MNSWYNKFPYFCLNNQFFPFKLYNMNDYFWKFDYIIYNFGLHSKK